VKKLICRFCKSEFYRIFYLRDHVAKTHHETYVKVSEHLNEVTEKLRVIEPIAQEGMQGFCEPAHAHWRSEADNR
jgi:hypothetical protein